MDEYQRAIDKAHRKVTLATGVIVFNALVNVLNTCLILIGGTVTIASIVCIVSSSLGVYLGCRWRIAADCKLRKARYSQLEASANFWKNLRINGSPSEKLVADELAPFYRQRAREARTEWEKLERRR